MKHANGHISPLSTYLSCPPFSFTEKNSFGIMHKDEKKKMKFAAKDSFHKTTWKQTIEKQIEKYCPTDTTMAGGESMVTFGSPR